MKYNLKNLLSLQPKVKGTLAYTRMFNEIKGFRKNLYATVNVILVKQSIEICFHPFMQIKNYDDDDLIQTVLELTTTTTVPLPQFNFGLKLYSRFNSGTFFRQRCPSACSKSPWRRRWSTSRTSTSRESLLKNADSRRGTFRGS